jgi:hypothetical protein
MLAMSVRLEPGAARFSAFSRWIVPAAAIILVPAPLSAHVPVFVNTNLSLETALQVKEPAKSWVYYGEPRSEQDARWYCLDLDSGDPMVFELFVSPDSDPGFLPKLAVIGPGIAPSGDLPRSFNLQGPPASVYSGVRCEEPEFEPFTPSRLFFTLRIDSTAPASGRYYAVVFSERADGRFGLAVGSSESFTLAEWINIPIAVVGTYRWEGQPLALVLLPFGVVVAVGLCLLLFRIRQKRIDWGAALGVLAGLTFLGSAALYGTQVLSKIFSARTTELWAMFVPPAILSVQILLGIGVIRSAWKRRPARIAVYGLLGLFSWAGYVVGPAIALVSSIAVVVRDRSVR